MGKTLNDIWQQAADELAEVLPDNTQDVTMFRESETGRDRFGKLLPGHTGNPHGRPRKGQTIADRVAKADAAVARKAIRARDKRLELTNAVGAREWSTYLAYNLGLPAQKFILSQGVSEADALDAILLANQGMREAVEGEYVVQPQGETG